jgi:hypothetical protein
MNFLEFISNKARQAGWKISKVHSDTLVSLLFETDGGDERVYIRPCGKNVDGNTILEFTSQGIPVSDDEDFAHAFAMMALERNGEMLMGHWGIEKLGDERYFTVFVSMIANTMDLDEFRAAVRAVLTEREHLRKALQSASVDF